MFTTPASKLMTAPVRTVLDSDPLTRARDEMAKLGVSALVVVERSGGMVGVISHSDLLRAGRVRLMNGHRKKVLSLPEASVQKYMTQTIEVVTPDTALFEVARRMQRHHIHRIFVSEDRKPLGVVSTTEMMHAVASARVSTPLSELMHRSVVSVNSDDPLSLAIDRLGVAHHSGIVVLEDRWPVGVFTQADALIARNAPPDDRVDHWMDMRLIMMPMHMPLFRAAEQLAATRSRRLIAVDAEGTRGILSGMDFARCVAEMDRTHGERS